ncbi:MAG: M48 family metalloprotease [Candidatus Omnitrophica bacterium]|nr:M48 family metalloprotease [Candidatus Omnitrophota bacterium]
MLQKIVALFLSLSLAFPVPFGIADVPSIPDAQAIEGRTLPGGKIQESFSGQAGKPRIYFILDAHTSLQAQKNISGLIQYLIREKGVQTVFKEGNQGKYFTREIFGGGRKGRKARAARDWLEDQRISGASFSHILHDYNFEYVGVDDMDTYARHLAAYQELLQIPREVDNQLDQLDRSVQTLFNSSFPKNFSGLLKLKRHYEQKGFGFERYAEALCLYSGKNVQEIKSAEVFQKLEKEILQGELKTPKQKTIFELQEKIELLNSLFDAALTPAQYRRFLAISATLTTKQIVTEISKLGGQIPTDWKETTAIELWLEPAIRFYDLALKRDEILFRRLNREVQSKNIRSAILVAGGFHKPGITELFQKNGYGYEVVVPSITNIDSSEEARYHERILQGQFAPPPPKLADFSGLGRMVPAPELCVMGWELKNGKWSCSLQTAIGNARAIAGNEAGAQSLGAQIRSKKSAITSQARRTGIRKLKVTPDQEVLEEEIPHPIRVGTDQVSQLPPFSLAWEYRKIAELFGDQDHRLWQQMDSENPRPKPLGDEDAEERLKFVDMRGGKEDKAVYIQAETKTVKDFLEEDVAKERELGRVVEPGALVDWTEIILKKIQAQAGLDPENFELLVTRSNVGNAFIIHDKSLKKNHIRLEGGLLRALEKKYGTLKPGHVAFVLGHELGHFVKGHYDEVKEKPWEFQKDPRRISSAEHGIHRAKDRLKRFQFGQNQEMEADALALEWMDKAGFNLDEALEVLKLFQEWEEKEKEEQKSKADMPLASQRGFNIRLGIFDTHPSSYRRFFRAEGTVKRLRLQAVIARTDEVRTKQSPSQENLEIASSAYRPPRNDSDGGSLRNDGLSELAPSPQQKPIYAIEELFNPEHVTQKSNFPWSELERIFREADTFEEQMRILFFIRYRYAWYLDQKNPPPFYSLAALARGVKAPDIQWVTLPRVLFGFESKSGKPLSPEETKEAQLKDWILENIFSIEKPKPLPSIENTSADYLMLARLLKPIRLNVKDSAIPWEDLIHDAKDETSKSQDYADPSFLSEMFERETLNARGFVLGHVIDSQEEAFQFKSPEEAIQFSVDLYQTMGRKDWTVIARVIGKAMARWASKSKTLNTTQALREWLRALKEAWPDEREGNPAFEEWFVPLAHLALQKNLTAKERDLRLALKKKENVEETKAGLETYFQQKRKWILTLFPQPSPLRDELLLYLIAQEFDVYQKWEAEWQNNQIGSEKTDDIAIPLGTEHEFDSTRDGYRPPTPGEDFFNRLDAITNDLDMSWLEGFYEEELIQSNSDELGAGVSPIGRLASTVREKDYDAKNRYFFFTAESRRHDLARMIGYLPGTGSKLWEKMPWIQMELKPGALVSSAYLGEVGSMERIDKKKDEKVRQILKSLRRPKGAVLLSGAMRQKGFGQMVFMGHVLNENLVWKIYNDYRLYLKLKNWGVDELLAQEGMFRDELDEYDAYQSEIAIQDAQADDPTTEDADDAYLQARYRAGEEEEDEDDEAEDEPEDEPEEESPLEGGEEDWADVDEERRQELLEEEYEADAREMEREDRRSVKLIPSRYYTFEGAVDWFAGKVFEHHLKKPQRKKMWRAMTPAQRLALILDYFPYFSANRDQVIHQYIIPPPEKPAARAKFLKSDLAIPVFEALSETVDKWALGREIYRVRRAGSVTLRKDLRKQLDLLRQTHSPGSPSREEAFRSLMEERTKLAGSTFDVLSTWKDFDQVEAFRAEEKKSSALDQAAMHTALMGGLEEVFANANVRGIDRVNLVLWIADLRKEPPYLVDVLKRVGKLTSRETDQLSDWKNKLTQGDKQILLKELLAGKKGFLTSEDAAARREFLNQLFPMIFQESEISLETRQIFKAVYDTMLSVMDPHRAAEILSVFLLAKLENRSFEELVKTFFEAFGFVGVKIAQYLVSQTDFLPESMRAVLMDLTSRVEGPSKEIIFEMAEKTFGKEKARKIIKHIGRKMGAGSFMMFYEVELQDGRKGVVGLLKPDVIQSLPEDLYVVHRTIEVMQEAPHLFGNKILGMDLMDNLIFQSLAETNLTRTVSLQEAMRQDIQVFQKSGSAEDGIQVGMPAIWNEPIAVDGEPISLNGGLFIFMDQAPGITLDLYLKQIESSPDGTIKRDNIMKTLVRLIVKQFGEYGLIHADLHPGNILVRERKIKGRTQLELSIIDAGLSTRLSPPIQEALQQILRIILGVLHPKEIPAAWSEVLDAMKRRYGVGKVDEAQAKETIRVFLEILRKESLERGKPLPWTAEKEEEIVDTLWNELSTGLDDPRQLMDRLNRLPRTLNVVFPREYYYVLRMLGITSSFWNAVSPQEMLEISGELAGVNPKSGSTKRLAGKAAKEVQAKIEETIAEVYGDRISGMHYKMKLTQALKEKSFTAQVYGVIHVLADVVREMGASREEITALWARLKQDEKLEEQLSLEKWTGWFDRLRTEGREENEEDRKAYQELTGNIQNYEPGEIRKLIFENRIGELPTVWSVDRFDIGRLFRLEKSKGVSYFVVVNPGELGNPNDTRLCYFGAVSGKIFTESKQKKAAEALRSGDFTRVTQFLDEEGDLIYRRSEKGELGRPSPISTLVGETVNGQAKDAVKVSVYDPVSDKWEPVHHYLVEVGEKPHLYDKRSGIQEARVEEAGEKTFQEIREEIDLARAEAQLEAQMNSVEHLIKVDDFTNIDPAHLFTQTFRLLEYMDALDPVNPRLLAKLSTLLVLLELVTDGPPNLFGKSLDDLEYIIRNLERRIENSSVKEWLDLKNAILVKIRESDCIMYLEFLRDGEFQDEREALPVLEYFISNELNDGYPQIFALMKEAREAIVSRAEASSLGGAQLKFAASRTLVILVSNPLELEMILNETAGMIQLGAARLRIVPVHDGIRGRMEQARFGREVKEKVRTLLQQLMRDFPKPMLSGFSGKVAVLNINSAEMKRIQSAVILASQESKAAGGIQKLIPGASRVVLGPGETWPVLWAASWIHDFQSREGRQLFVPLAPNVYRLNTSSETARSMIQSLLQSVEDALSASSHIAAAA